MLKVESNVYCDVCKAFIGVGVKGNLGKMIKVKNHHYHKDCYAPPSLDPMPEVV